QMFRFLIALATLPLAADVPLLSVCEILDNRLDYNQKPVIVVGKFHPGMEGTWLLQDCGHDLVINGYSWRGYSIWLPGLWERYAAPSKISDEFQSNLGVMIQKLAEVRKTTTLAEPFLFLRNRYVEEWVAVFGRFETRAKYPKQNFSKDPVG